MALPMVTRWGVHDVAAFPTDTHLDAPGLNHGRFRTCLTMTLPDPTRPVPIEDSSRCDRRPAKSHAPMLRAVMRFGADTRSAELLASSHVRTHAQSRAGIESSRARVPYIAGREFSPATTLRTRAHAKYPTRLPARLRPQSLTSPSTAPGPPAKKSSARAPICPTSHRIRAP